MKKLTLWLFSAIMMVSVSAQVQRRWQGGQEIRVWDYATPNWLNPASPLPIPTTFMDGAVALFDNSILRDSDTLRISGSINAASVTVNATKPYVIRRTADTDVLTGLGTLTKMGTGTLTLDFRNSLTGGTILRQGLLVQERQNSPNVYGSRLVIEGGTVAMGFAGNGSSAYTVSTIPIEIPTGSTAGIQLPRYSNFASKVTGGGTMELFCSGERVHLGYHSLPSGVTSAMPDLSEFTGTIRIIKHTTAVTPGFWGLVLSSSRTFDILTGTGIDSTLANKRMIIGSGATMASHSGSRAYLIGELIAEDETAILSGFRSSSTTPRIYYMVGALNTDVVFRGRIGQAPGISTRYNHVCFVKVGTGTYTLTHPNNDMIGGMIVRQGTVLVNDPVQSGNVMGGVGNWVQVESNGTLGGTGRIQGNVDVWGKLTPGANGIGTLSIRDTLSVLPTGTGGVRAYNLNFHPGSVSEFEIQSSTHYDQVVASGTLRFFNDELQIQPRPLIKISVSPNHVINDGDVFEIIQARNLNINSAAYNVEFPTVPGITWLADVVEVLEEPVSYKVVIRAKTVSGLSNASLENQVSLYPNPMVGNEITFKSNAATIQTVEIINLQGVVVQRKDVHTLEVKWNVHDLGKGLYFARIHTDKGIVTHKFQRN